MVKKIAIFGAQGSGKGTQAELISENCGLIHISTGDLLRQETQQKTELGNEALEYMNAGKLVPDQLMNKILDKRLHESDVEQKGFILDGYPRNISQQKSLSKITDLTEVLVVEITDEEAVRRIGGRRVTKGGKIYHVIYNPPPKDLDEEVFTRPDDTPEAIRKRLAIYHKETEPVIQEYEKQGIVKRINGMGSIAEVFELTKKVLKLQC